LTGDIYPLDEWSLCLL